MALGLEAPDAGAVRFAGSAMPPAGTAAWRKLRARMQLVPQDPLGALDRRLRVRAQIAEPLLIHGIGDVEDRVAALLEDVGLTEYIETPAVLLSYGRKRALEIATTLALDPKMLLLDEPTAGMTHEDVDRIVALIKRIRQGRTILMVEHNLSVVEGLCDRITVLARGQVLAEGDYASVSRNPEVIAAYLGTEAAAVDHV